MKDEAVRRMVMSATQPHADQPHQPHEEQPGAELPARRLVEMDPEEAMELLAGVSYGRVVFTRNALPAVRPVNHVVDDGEIIIRTRLSAKVADTVDQVVAYEADDLDPVRRLGWSVVATGTARLITDPERVARYEEQLRPWADLPMDTTLGIHPAILSGFRFVENA